MTLHRNQRIFCARLQEAFVTSSSHHWWLRRKEELYPLITQNEKPQDGAAISSTSIKPGGKLLTLTFPIAQRIYILGAGNVGNFFAHSIAGIPHSPSITLLFHSAFQRQRWESCGSSIEVITEGVGDRRQGFGVEMIGSDHSTVSSGSDSTSGSIFSSSSGDRSNKNPYGADTIESETIHQLIVSVRAPYTVHALSQVAARLSQSSTILFLQNGIGVIDEVNKNIFPDENARPTYMVGVSSHRLYKSGSTAFSMVHAVKGSTALGIFPRHSMLKPWTMADYSSNMAPSARSLMRTLTRTPMLAAVGFPPTNILQQQLEKLAVNAIINPLTAIFDCRNGQLFENSPILRVIRLLISEISLVIRSLPELQGVPNVTKRFAPDRLEQMIHLLATNTIESSSSMLLDVRSARLTEIDYLNGYIVRRGEEMGIKCVMNYMLVQMVKGKTSLIQKSDAELLPF